MTKTHPVPTLDELLTFAKTGFMAHLTATDPPELYHLRAFLVAAQRQASVAMFPGLDSAQATLAARLLALREQAVAVLFTAESWQALLSVDDPRADLIRGGDLHVADLPEDERATVFMAYAEGVGRHARCQVWRVVAGPALELDADQPLDVGPAQDGLHQIASRFYPLLPGNRLRAAGRRTHA